MQMASTRSPLSLSLGASRVTVSIVAVLATVALKVPLMSAFVICGQESRPQVQPPARNRLGPRLTRLYGMLPRDDSDDEEDDSSGSEVEAARSRFESMMGASGSASTQQEDPHVFFEKKRPSSSFSLSLLNSRDRTPHPPLTTTMRERRLAEISLLSSLQHSDEALSELWSLWVAERGPLAASRLLAAEELASHPKDWTLAETKFRELISEYGIYWLEPVNRLATLYYLQGNLQEAKRLCELVLALKPWHFGALSGIVLVCAAIGDAVTARLWADRRLPPLVPNLPNSPNDSNTRRRKDWVTRAVEEAEASLDLAEEITFGPCTQDWTDSSDIHERDDDADKIEITDYRVDGDHFFEEDDDECDLVPAAELAKIHAEEDFRTKLLHALNDVAEFDPNEDVKGDLWQ